MLKAIHAAEVDVAVLGKAPQVVAELKDQRMMQATEIVKLGVYETLAYYAFTGEFWRLSAPNNPLEHAADSLEAISEPRNAAVQTFMYFTSQNRRPGTF